MGPARRPLSPHTASYGRQEACGSAIALLILGGVQVGPSHTASYGRQEGCGSAIALLTACSSSGVSAIEAAARVTTSLT